MTNRHVVILSGGAGTRLWPLSRESLPKQFHDLTGSGQPLLKDTLDRFRDLADVAILTTENLRSPTLGLINRYGLTAQVVAEPEARNTAAAVALATWSTLKKHGGDAVLGIFPADQAIRKVDAFREILRRGFEAAEQGAVVTLGIRPDHPATAYGYMELSSAPTYKGDVMPVQRFLEKPTAARAAELIATGKVVWNAGIFLFRAKVMWELFRKHMPEMHAAFESITSDAQLKTVYGKLQKISVDFAIMEKLPDIRCLPVDLGWTDLGSWEAVADYQNPHGALEVGGQGNVAWSLGPAKKRATFVGVSDTYVVDTPDALLVLKKGHGQDVRDIVERLKTLGESVATKHPFEERPWGRFEVLLDTEYFKSKRILVSPGQKLSYQSHAKRAEHWIIVKGRAEVVLNDGKRELKAGEYVYIPLGAKHRIGNPGPEPMEFIEVQVGSYFGEDDIVRYSDDYGRGPTT